jgi:mannose-6-phosphate isomerase-like protein (cupin superfamily)
MRRMSLTLTALLALIAGLVVPTLRFTPVMAQDNGAEVDTLFQVSLEDAELPPTRVYLRLLYINMEPGSSNPAHTHPGPELWRVDTGTVTVKLDGPGVLRRGGEDEEAAPVGEEFEIQRGDQLTILPSTPMVFSNKSEEEVRILAAVILPAGHQAPPGIDYMGQTPAEDDYQGLEFPILADGLLETVPAGTTTLTIDRIRLGSGQTLPASTDPALVSVARGSLEFTVDSGLVYVSRTATPGPSETPVEGGTAVTLGRYDAAFFPAGLSEAPRSENLADVTLYRLTVSGEEGDATPVAAEDVAKISVSGPIAEETPEAEATVEPEATATAEATAEPTKEPTVEPTDGNFQAGQTVYVSDTDVRLRDAPTTNSNIVTGLTIGQALTITGESVDADDIVWWPVTSPDDETFTGWVAEQFLSADPIE